MKTDLKPICNLPRLEDRQLRLFPVETPNWSVPITTHGYARYLTGDFFEEATATVSGAVRLKTDSRCYCPDLRWDESIYFETKAIGKSNRAIIYDHRLEKDRVYCRRKRISMYYWFWRHTHSVLQSPDHRHLQSSLGQSIVEIFVVSLGVVEHIVSTIPLKILNTGGTIKTGPNAGQRLGYGGKGYGKGWSLPVTELQECSALTCMYMPGFFSVYGHPLTALRIYTISGDLPKCFHWKQQA